MQAKREGRLNNEIKHGEFLAKRGAGDVWDRNTPAGKIRWARRIGLLTRHIKPNTRVLEIGCGIGYLTGELSRTGASISAIDISPDLVKIAKENIKAPNVTFKIDNAYNTTFLNNEFDLIVGSSVLHHLDIDKALSEFYRILKDDGVIIFTEPNMLNPQIFIQKNIPFVKKMMGDSPDETAFVRWSLKKKLLKHGFNDISIVPFDFLHPHIPKKLLNLAKPACDMAEKVPLLSEIAGSLYIIARK